MRMIRLCLLALVSLVLLTGFGFKKQSPEQQREEIDSMATEVLADLYREVPGSEELVERAQGYAVFSSMGVNVFVLATANGEGVVQYKDSGEKVYMKMYSAGTGAGMGVKDFRQVFIFETTESLDNFVENGWTAGVQADAAATHEDQGDAAALAIDVSPGVKLYQLTESGLALQLTIQGTRYLKDDELN